MIDPIIGTVDLASISLYLFWGFFALLIYYLQTENMREGYPMESDDGAAAANQGPFPLPKQKTFKLTHGRGSVTVPDGLPEGREVALAKVGPGNGFPLEPTGDPMIDGVGPASWAPRRDVPELTGTGHNKIVPLRNLPEFHVSAGTDPRGMSIVAADGLIVGEVTDIWVDEPEQMVRYLEFKMENVPGAASGQRLVPLTLAAIRSNRVDVHSLYSEQFAGLHTTAQPDVITMLEEEKICAYYGGGKLYGGNRQDPIL